MRQQPKATQNFIRRPWRQSWVQGSELVPNAQAIVARRWLPTLRLICEVQRSSIWPASCFDWGVKPLSPSSRSRISSSSMRWISLGRWYQDDTMRVIGRDSRLKDRASTRRSHNTCLSPLKDISGNKWVLCLVGVRYKVMNTDLGILFTLSFWIKISWSTIERTVGYVWYTSANNYIAKDSRCPNKAI